MRPSILSVSPFPGSPPIFGAQRRIQGLLVSLAKRHVVDLTRQMTGLARRLGRHFNYFPNRDGILFFLREVWPRVSANHPDARLKVVGADPPPEVLAYQDARVEVAGVVEDLRPHLGEAAVAVAPLLVGRGTRLKIVEAMARPVVSTSHGAEGIAATPEHEILIANEPAAFAATVGRILDERALGVRIGEAARTLVVARFSWEMTTRHLERLYSGVLKEPRPSNGAGVAS